MRYYVDDNGYLQSHHPEYDITLTRQLLPEDAYQSEIVPWLGINHSESGGGKVPWWQIWKYWNRTDIDTEPHWVADMDGHVNQNIRFTRKADNNYKANSWVGPDGRRYGAISNETQDEGGATVNTILWTPDQFESIAQVWAAVVKKYNWPIQRCASPYSQGIDGHYRYQEWSVYKGKTCPGYARQGQLDLLLFRIDQILREDATPPEQPKQVITLTRSSEEEEVMLNYNGMILAYDGFTIRRVKSGRAVINPLTPVDRQTVADIVSESRVQGPNPFNGNVSGYKDDDLAYRWDLRGIQGMTNGTADNL